VTFAVPGALFGLALLPALWLLRRWRDRPRDLTWPSLLLWERAAAGGTAARRSVDPLLVLESIAVLVLVLAASGPVLGARTALRVVVHVDEGPHMDARRSDGRTAREATRAEIERLRAAAGRAADEAAVVEVPWRGGPAGGPIATGRDVPGGFGYAAEGFNLGIGAVDVRDGRLWFTVETDGPPRTVRVRVAGEPREVRTGRGVEAPFTEGGAVRILTPDNYDGDDEVVLRRARPVARDETGSREVKTAMFLAGLRAVEGDVDGGETDLVVRRARGEVVAEVVPGRECVARSALFAGLALDECVWREPREAAGAPALTWRGRTLASFQDGVLELGPAVDRPWDEHGTLAVLVERALRAAVHARLGPGAALAGEAVARPAPRFVDTRGVDRPWDGSLPQAAREGGIALRTPLALAGVAALAACLVLLLRR